MSLGQSIDNLFSKKDVDEAPSLLSHNPVFLLAVAALAGFVIWKASGVLTLPFFIVVASLTAFLALLYVVLHVSALYFSFKLISDRQQLLLKDGKVDPGDLEALESIDHTLPDAKPAPGQVPVK